MKKIILLITLLLVFIPIKASALEDSFHEGEYIPNTYIKKFRGSSGKYEQMRVFRRNRDNRVVYCLELWENMNANKSLKGAYSSNTMSQELQQKLFLIAYYGYGYKDHTDIKWYAVTQYMIWNLLEENSTIYFTDVLNGNRISKYESEMAEINSLVNGHNILPTLPKEVELSYNEELTLIDTNNMIDKYEIINREGLNVKTKDNQIIVKTDKTGSSKLLVRRVDTMYTNPSVIYTDNNGQDLLLPGTFATILLTINFNIKTTDLYINKIDYDTLESIPTGEASFKDTTFELYDIDHNYINTETINENNKIVFKNIGYGTYYLKEIKTGEGYVLNDEEIKIKVNDNNTINIPNHVIKNKILIHKYLSNLDGSHQPEEATFMILNSNGVEVGSFETKDGSYELELPYGKYTFKQLSGKDNYKFVEDFEIDIKEDNITQSFDLYDEEIKEVGDITEPVTEIEEKEIIYDIPNTYIRSSVFDIKMLLLLISIVLIHKDKANEED